MTKRAKGKFERRPRDFYATPESAVLPLLPHLELGSSFEEPCAGDGALVDMLERCNHFCAYASDISPGCREVAPFDVFNCDRISADYFITNPPWSRPILHKIIVHLSDIAPTWLLFDADWIHTKQSVEYMKRCRKIVSVGRVSWMGNGTVGFDNCAWYLFDKPSDTVTEFHPRMSA